MHRHPAMAHSNPVETPAGTGVSRRRFLYAVPAVGFAAFVVALAWSLTRNPRELPSTLIGKPAPRFSLPPVQGRALGLSSADLNGEVSLVNVFASWCVACRAEHPVFMRLKEDGVIAIHGINYKDAPEDAARWLDTLGDPYTRTGADLDGRVSIEWGVYGVPETFVIDREGRIVFKQVGPVTPEVYRNRMGPLIQELRK